MYFVIASQQPLIYSTNILTGGKEEDLTMQLAGQRATLYNDKSNLENPKPNSGIPGAQEIETVEGMEQHVVTVYLDLKGQLFYRIRSL